jgi:hypothetical protein
MGISRTPQAIVPASFFSGITSASSSVATSQTTTSASYTDLATAGPAVTLTTGTKALVIVSCGLAQSNIGARSYIGYAVSGATTIAATDNTAVMVQAYASGGQMIRASSVSRLNTLTAGSNTFTAKYRASTGTSTFAEREICVIDLGS